MVTFLRLGLRQFFRNSIALFLGSYSAITTLINNETGKDIFALVILFHFTNFMNVL